MPDTTYSELTGEDLDRRAAELNIEGRSSMSAEEKRKAIALAESGNGPDASEAEAPTQATNEDDDFRAQQRADAAAQNQTAENAVPERRPQASQQADPLEESELTKRLREAGELPSDEPMPKSAYDLAQSRADSGKVEGVREGLMAGNVAVATKGPHEGRVFAVTGIEAHGSVADMVRSATGDPRQLYNSPARVAVTAIGDERDGERLVLDVEEHGLVKQNEAVRGTRAGRRH